MIFFLISETLFTDTDESKILPGYKTDHSLVLLKFDFGKFEKGRSYWKFNNSLLKDSKYVEEIKNVIKSTKELYAAQNQTHNLRIEEIPIQDLKLSIDDILFYDVLLMEIRGKTISYASFKKKLEVNNENKLLEEIDKIEKETNINHEQLDIKRKELYDIRQKKMEGVKIRSKVRWINDGEKVTKYFCNLENRNFTSKCMNSIKNKNGNILKKQSEILNETKLFYKQLYSKKNATEVNLNKLLNTFNLPKVESCSKSKLEGPLTYQELLFCLKKTSNNTSPGFDGFSYEFFKFFWKDLGHFILRSINASFNKGEFSESMKRGIITCIPKGNKDKILLKKLEANIIT